MGVSNDLVLKDDEGQDIVPIDISDLVEPKVSSRAKHSRRGVSISGTWRREYRDNKALGPREPKKTKPERKKDVHRIFSNRRRGRG